MTMVSDQQVAALRAALTFDAPLAREWQAYLIGSGDLDGFSELVYAAFAVAARRYFGGSGHARTSFGMWGACALAGQPMTTSIR